MMDAFLQWKYPTANMQPPPTTSTLALSPVNTGEALAHGGPPATVESYDFTINTIDVFSLNTTATIKHSKIFEIRGSGPCSTGLYWLLARTTNTGSVPENLGVVPENLHAQSIIQHRSVRQGHL
jgi:hypothetical protein